MVLFVKRATGAARPRQFSLWPIRAFALQFVFNLPGVLGDQVEDKAKDKVALG